MILFQMFDDEILKLYGAERKFKQKCLQARLEEDLYLLLAILPVDETVAISPTFLFESRICEKIIINNIELVENGFLVLLMKEPSIYDVFKKKESRYGRVLKYPKYGNAYKEKRLWQLQNIPFHQIRKSISIGPVSFSLFTESIRRNRTITSRRSKDLVKRLQETESESFLWESVVEQLQNARYTDEEILNLRVREEMTNSYLRAYQEQGKLMLVNDAGICPSSDDCINIDIQKINRLFKLLKIKDLLLMMGPAKFCQLKLNEDFIENISLVRKLLEQRLSSEDIMRRLHEEKIDLTLNEIIRGVCGIQKEVKHHMTDVLIMIATQEEEQAIISNGDWERTMATEPHLHEYYTCERKGIKFALSRGYDMGESDAAIMAQTMITHLQPRVIAMAGFCAGNSGKVHLGDIIIASKVYSYDIGKQISKIKVLPDISNYDLRGDWRQFIERMDQKWLNNIDIQVPLDFDWQCIELLSELRRIQKLSVNKVDFNKYPDWENVIKKLEDDRYISIDGKNSLIFLTTEGEKYIGEYIIRNPRYVAEKPSVHIGPIATGTRVQVWSKIFEWLETAHTRKTCALDMESHVIGKLGAFNDIPFIVVKGVGDFADDGKPFANRFIQFTSFVSCEYIINLFTADDFKPYWYKPTS